MMKKIYLVIFFIILIIGGVIVYQNSQKSKIDVSSKLGPAQISPQQEFVITEKEHIQGKIEAPITIVEFSDFQCPFCSSFQPTVDRLLKEFPDKLRLVFKHFPLDAIHQQARPAAEASECAGEQGKFWEYTARLFENQGKLGESFYKELAGNLNLNLNQFENCFSSRKYKDEVEADLQEGLRAGVRGTPTSFINGEFLPGGAVPYPTLKVAIEKALAEF